MTKATSSPSCSACVIVRPTFSSLSCGTAWVADFQCHSKYGKFIEESIDLDGLFGHFYLSWVVMARKGTETSVIYKKPGAIGSPESVSADCLAGLLLFSCVVIMFSPIWCATGSVTEAASDRRVVLSETANTEIKETAASSFKWFLELEVATDFEQSIIKKPFLIHWSHGRISMRVARPFSCLGNGIR